MRDTEMWGDDLAPDDLPAYQPPVPDEPEGDYCWSCGEALDLSWQREGDQCQACDASSWIDLNT